MFGIFRFLHTHKRCHPDIALNLAVTTFAFSLFSRVPGDSLPSRATQLVNTLKGTYGRVSKRAQQTTTFTSPASSVSVCRLRRATNTIIITAGIRRSRLRGSNGDALSRNPASPPSSFHRYFLHFAAFQIPPLLLFFSVTRPVARLICDETDRPSAAVKAPRPTHDQKRQAPLNKTE